MKNSSKMDNHSMSSTKHLVTPSTSKPQAYTCQTCGFSAVRLNVIVLHSKYCSGGPIQSQSIPLKAKNPDPTPPKMYVEKIQSKTDADEEKKKSDKKKEENSDKDKPFDINSMPIVMNDESLNIEENVNTTSPPTDPITSSSASSPRQKSQLIQVSSAGQLVITSKGTVITSQSQTTTTTTSSSKIKMTSMPSTITSSQVIKMSQPSTQNILAPNSSSKYSSSSSSSSTDGGAVGMCNLQENSELIAVPAKKFGGPSNLFYLCSVVNNKLLYVDASNGQLVALPDDDASLADIRNDFLDSQRTTAAGDTQLLNLDFNINRDSVESCTLCYNSKDLILINGQMNNIIKKHLSTKFQSEKVCRHCWAKTQEFHQFHVKIEQTHNILWEVTYPEELPPPITPSPKQTINRVCSVSSIESYINSEGDEPKMATRKNKSFSDADKKVKEFCKTNGIKMKCDDCSLTFETFYKMRDHFKKNHKTNGYLMCCANKFTERFLLLQHINTHQNPNFFYCEICKKNFPNKRLLQLHNNNIHEIKQYKCDKCPSTFGQKKNLKLHESVHLTKKDFGCDLCVKHYKTKHQLQNHRNKVHFKRQQKICEFCSKVIQGWCGLKNHIEYVHGLEKKVQCKICENYFKHEVTLSQHMETHEGKLFDCGVCEKKFKSSRALSHHKTVHMQRTHTCNTCDKAFQTKTVLNRHKKIHGVNNK